MSRKKITRARRMKNTSSCDEFLDMGYLLFNKNLLEYKGHPSLWFALISYNQYKYKDVFEYLEKMKQYDLKRKNYKRLEEVEKIQHLSEEDIIAYGEQKYKEYWEQLTREIDLELQIKDTKITRNRGEN